jgi:cytidine deaminase
MAYEAAKLAYARYSNFRVGAALMTTTGETYTGANVENASYGLSICAERATIAKAVGSGDTGLVRLAVACIDARPEAGINELMPCGACRQWFIEFAPDLEILVWSASEEIHRFMARDLLPVPFSLG